MFNPSEAAANIKISFVDYILSGHRCYSSKIQKMLRQSLMATISKGPYIALSDIFKFGKSIEELIKDPTCRLSPEFLTFEKGKALLREKHPEDPRPYKNRLPSTMKLYLHQEEALRKIQKGKNIVVTTGTGSGKTESFLIPIFDALMKEKEAGTLDAGVRAILIYPMNALANDQMKRLREYLLTYPDITFGSYNGETKETYKEALKIYKELHQTDIPELREPLSNELISRDQMRKAPPNILLTNYSMLEYLLLRPGDADLFKQKKVRFIVLDESHIYRGATGIETSILIQRLKAHLLEEGKRLQFVLTSATLGKKGENDDDIISFAENLTHEEFDKDDIIYGERVPFVPSKGNLLVIPSQFINRFAETSDEDIPNLFSINGLIYDPGKTMEENLYDVVSNSQLYKNLRDCYSMPGVGPSPIDEIARHLQVDVDFLIRYLSLCSTAEKNGVKLVDLKYHFFVRALEGAYISLGNESHVSLTRTEYYENAKDNDRMFEFAVCKKCGDIALVGQIKKDEGTGKNYLTCDDPLTQFDEKNQVTFFHIVRDGADSDDANRGNEDDDAVDDEEVEEEHPERADAPSQDQTEFLVCSKCGQIVPNKNGARPTCGHGHYVRLRQWKKPNTRCMYCFQGSYSRFYLGSEAATAILATTLYEQLPTKLCKIKTIEGSSVSFEGGKQFLTFSDSRGDAAFFASYLDASSRRLLARRGYVQLIRQMESELRDESKTIDCEEIADRLRDLFIKDRSFASSLVDNDSEEDLKILRNVSEKHAIMAVASQLTTARRPASLQSMGFLKYEYLGINDYIVSKIKNEYCPNYSDESIREFLNELALCFGYAGAFKLRDRLNVTNDIEVRREIFNVASQKEKTIVLQRVTSSTGNITGWLPRNKEGKPNEYMKSMRLSMVLRYLKSSDAKIGIEFLKDFFAFLLDKSKNKYPLVNYRDEQYQMPFSAFAVRVKGCKHTHWYRCKNCGTVRTYSGDLKCPVEKCGGIMEEYDDFQSLYADDHYYNFYLNPTIKAPIIKEHTAQLTKQKALDYQRKFEANEINALSCSTTFEMGVDVGELETVFMRNMPPSPANYAQRAGRAGRSRESAAFIITYAKLSSHDFNFFDQPKKMIIGRIKPPFFDDHNTKIVFRHIYSVLLGYFFKKYPQYFDNNNAFSFINEGYPILKEMLENGFAGDELSRCLQNSFGIELDKYFSISDYGEKWLYSEANWVDGLIGEKGLLTTAINRYFSDLKPIKKKIEYYTLGIEDQGLPFEIELEREQRRLNRLASPRLIEFLVAANVLPKYGFPVDTTTLRKKKEDGEFDGNELNLGRDLTQALSDYAPGAKVIADGVMYTSRYIRRISQGGEYDFDSGYVAKCSQCQTDNYSRTKPANGTKCVGCQSVIPLDDWCEAIQPSGGFYTEGDGEPVPIKKPEKMYRSEASYVGRNLPEHKYVFQVGQKRITLYSSQKDEIVVTSEKTHPFYVCPRCGYALGHVDTAYVLDGKNMKTDESNTKALRSGTASSIVSSHKDAEGKPCNKDAGKLRKYYLFHHFNTDIVQLFFNGVVFKNPDKDDCLRSLLEALLDATASVLGIERTDIAGTFRRNNEEGTNYRLVIYDNVPGGAGHVKHIVDENGRTLKNIIRFAYDKMKNCNCDPSCYHCLRSYENQFYHSHLNRHEVIRFLEDYHAFPFEKIDGKEKEDSLEFSDSYSVTYGDFATFFENGFSIPELSDFAARLLDDAKVPMPEKFCLSVSGHDGCVLMAWIERKILVIDGMADAIKAVLNQHPSWTTVDIREKDWANKIIQLVK